VQQKPRQRAVSERQILTIRPKIPLSKQFRHPEAEHPGTISRHSPFLPLVIQEVAPEFAP
jgi:hypothetical protein